MSNKCEIKVKLGINAHSKDEVRAKIVKWFYSIFPNGGTHEGVYLILDIRKMSLESMRSKIIVNVGLFEVDKEKADKIKKHCENYLSEKALKEEEVLEGFDVKVQYIED